MVHRGKTLLRICPFRYRTKVQFPYPGLTVKLALETVVSTAPTQVLSL